MTVTRTLSGQKIHQINQMPANASIIAITTCGQTKYYVRHPNGMVEPYERKRKPARSGEW